MPKRTPLSSIFFLESDSFVGLQKPSKLKTKSTQFWLHMAVHINPFLV
ncbi:hypothetical protein V6Z11_A08G094100 [Gossypium hirsutum]